MTSLITLGAADQAQPADQPSRLDTDHRDYLDRNRRAWERWSPDYAAVARKTWQEPSELGTWGIPESEARLLEGVEPRAEVIELGCGTAAISYWLARLGMRPVGVDFVRAQLATAARLQAQFDVSFGLLCANAEELHFDDASFDLAISEYGASLWCDPRQWLPEAHRLLRPRGRLLFITTARCSWPAHMQMGGLRRIGWSAISSMLIDSWSQVTVPWSSIWHMANGCAS